jgi:hypothetical protein
MTEVPNAIMWIACVGLVIMTIIMSALLITLTVLARKAKQLVQQLQEIAVPLKDAAESAGTTVSTFSNSLLRPLATFAGIVAGFRQGVGTVSGKKRKK